MTGVLTFHIVVIVCAGRNETVHCTATATTRYTYFKKTKKNYKKIDKNREKLATSNLVALATDLQVQ